MPVSSLLALAVLGFQAQPQNVQLTLIRSGLSEHFGGQAIAVSLSAKKPAGLVKAPGGATDLRYGVVRFGGQHVIIALGKLGGVEKLFVDANEDGDLSDDPRAAWKPRTAKLAGTGLARIQLPFQGHATLCSAIFIQSGPKALAVLPDYGYAGTLELGHQSVKFTLSDRAGTGFARNDLVGAILGFDRQGTGVMSGPGEVYAADQAFTINQTSLLLNSVDLLHGTASFIPTEAVTEIDPPRALTDKNDAPHFDTSDLNGKPVSFPADYHGNVVLLYAWASRSKPSLSFLSKVQQAAVAEKGRGFSVLGICLDRASQLDAAKTIAAQMPWTTTFDGKSWAGVASKALNLRTLPYLLLVDTRTGKIVATMSDMVGDKFESTIHSAVSGPATASQN